MSLVIIMRSIIDHLCNIGVPDKLIFVGNHVNIISGGNNNINWIDMCNIFKDNKIVIKRLFWVWIKLIFYKEYEENRYD